MTRAGEGQVQLGRRVAQARSIVEWTQARLAERVGVERSVLAKIESGTRRVSASELVALAAALERPVDWFFAESPVAVLSRRADPAVGGLSSRLDRQVELLARDVGLLVADGVLPRQESATLSVPTSPVQAEQRARQVRALLGQGTGPLLNLQAAAERLGLYAFSLDLGSAAGDAAYVALDGCGVAVVNGALDPGRRRFSLAHELGHHLFSDAYAPEIGLSHAGGTEKLINVFAVNLLLPRKAVQEMWSQFEPDARLAAVALAVRYRVSWSAVCSQLSNLDLIDSAHRQALAERHPTRGDFVALGESWGEELVAPAVPPDYGRRVLGAYRRGMLTVERTLELLCGAVIESELPDQAAVPIDALRRDFSPMP